jgi:hypothetical protein
MKVFELQVTVIFGSNPIIDTSDNSLGPTSDSNMNILSNKR